VEIACLDLEGVLIPEIWVAFAEKTGIDELKRTTRDEPDYNILMRYRLDILNKNNLGLIEIQEVINTLSPLDGAKDFLDWLRERFQVVILSDTLYDFAQPLMRQLGYPALLCHQLHVGEDNKLIGYKLRQANPKRQAIVGFKSMYYRTIAAGDSYNDITMLIEADAGILFHAPQNVTKEFHQFPAVNDFSSLKMEFIKASARKIKL
jgi:phosphoserine/homoserine phosphotransferase